MSVSISKGGNTSLTSIVKDAGGTLTEVTVGLGWDARTTAGAQFDLDASAFVLDGSGKVLGDKWFVFFGNLESPDGSVRHSGDNLTGQGDGDDEQITINLAALPAMAEKIVIAVTIYEAAQRQQNFGMVRNAFIRVTDKTPGAELPRYDLDEDFGLETAVVFGEIYRRGTEWKFKAVGQGYNDGLAGLCRDFGVNVA